MNLRPLLATLVFVLSCGSQAKEPIGTTFHGLGSCGDDSGADATVDSSSDSPTDVSDGSSDSSDALADASDASDSGPVGCEGGVDAGLGTTGAWTQLTLPSWTTGDTCQSIVTDPVNPGSLVTGCGNNDGRHIKWYASKDFGNTWTLTNSTTMSGSPWGFTGDPNSSRDPCTPQTLYSPAGYGSYGAWKSTDGAVTWTRLTGADTAFHPVSPFGPTDLYEVAVLPDDPPNHVLATYHYYFKGDAGNLADGGFGESWDGGASWVIHMPPAGIGTSHYVLPISGTTWVVIAQSNNSINGMWRTTTAGRIGGTAPFDYRDGTISTSAWSKVTGIEHTHGSYSPTHIGSVWYSPGLTSSEGSIWKSTDDGNSWTDLQPGYYWASPPNSAFMNKNASGVAATPSYLYSNYFTGPQVARAPVGSDTVWLRNYVTVPTDGGLNGNGSNPLGSAATVQNGHGVVFMATNVGVWRFIEP